MKRKNLAARVNVITIFRDFISVLLQNFSNIRMMGQSRMRKFISSSLSLIGICIIYLTVAFVLVPQSTAQAEEKIGSVRADGILHVNADGAAKIIGQNPKVVILDVRTPAEFARGHIKGAINIDFYGPDFKKKLSLLDKESEYLIHCRSGARSGRSLPIMQSVGLVNVIHMDNGIISWVAAGLPITKN